MGVTLNSLGVFQKNNQFNQRDSNFALDIDYFALDIDYQ